MDPVIEIRGVERDRLIEKLATDRTLIKMSVENGGVSTITVVTGIRAQGRESLFSVDCPKGMRSSMLEHGADGIHFEWTGQHDIPYRFSVQDVREMGSDLWMKFPETILYFQKRKHFRIIAPEGTVLAFTWRDDTFRMPLSDISVGGLRCEQWAAKTLPVDLVLKKGDCLVNAEVLFPTGERIPVRLAEVRWVDGGRKANLNRYGVQFKNMDKHHDRELNAIVYRYQREYLRRRLPMDDPAWKRLR